MSFIALFIPTAALREAVLEQVALMAFGETKECAHWDDVGNALEAGAKALLIESACLEELQNDVRARVEASLCPVFMLGDTGSTEDWITESFSFPLRLGLLMARLRYYLETAPKLHADAISFGTWQLEPQHKRITHKNSGKSVRLTEKECSLLSYLAQESRLVPREELLASIWGYDARIDTHTLESHIYQLRRKLAFCDEGKDILVNKQGAYALREIGE